MDVLIDPRGVGQFSSFCLPFLFFSIDRIREARSVSDRRRGFEICEVRKMELSSFLLCNHYIYNKLPPRGIDKRRNDAHKVRKKWGVGRGGRDTIG